MSMNPYELYANLAQSGDIRAWASQNAQSAYYDSIAKGNDAATALKAAQFEWTKKLDEAGQTGMWNGQYNMPSQQWFTGQFGTWMPGGPQAGQQTTAYQNQLFNQGQGLGSMYGEYYAPGTGPAAGTQTLAATGQAQQSALAQAGLTGWYTPTVSNTVSPSRFSYDASAEEQQQYLAAAGNDPAKAAQNWAANASNAVAQFNKDHPQQAQQTLAGQGQQWGQQFQQQGYEAQQRQLAQTNTLDYMKLLASLRGPADWAKYQQVLGSTPQGMRDLYAAAAGQYVPGGGATTGMQPTAADLGTMQQQIAGGGQANPNLIAQYGQSTGMGGYNPQAQAAGGNVWGGSAPPPGGAANPQALYNQYWSQANPESRGNLYTPQGQTQPNWYASQYANQGKLGAGQPNGQQAATDQQNAAMMQGGGQEVWGSGIDAAQSATQNSYQQARNAMGGGANMYGAQQQQNRLPAPNQIAAQSWNNMAPSQQQMLLGEYESQGWDKNDVQALYNQSLPKYGSTNQSTAGTWRMK